MWKQRLIDRLAAADPGWEIYQTLRQYVETLEFELVETRNMGNFIVNGMNLVFRVAKPESVWPDWLPPYVSALYGMQGYDWEMCGGYAVAFENKPPVKGGVFSSAGNDEALGYPLIDIPDGILTFQYNESGAQFFINPDLEVLYPSTKTEDFQVLDKLDRFTQINISQFLEHKFWMDAYSGSIEGTLLD